MNVSIELLRDMKNRCVSSFGQIDDEFKNQGENAGIASTLAQVEQSLGKEDLDDGVLLDIFNSLNRIAGLLDVDWPKRID